jgi:exonuclease SbcC
MAEESEAIKRERDALKQEAEELRDQCRGALALKEHIDEVIKERDALILEAQHNAVIIKNTMEERDALRLEIEKLQARSKDSGKLEEKLNSLKQICRDITKERDALSLKTQDIAADTAVLKEERNALELETKNLRAQCEKTALLEKELKDVKAQRDFIAKERDSFQYRHRRSEKECKSIKKCMETLKVETEAFRTQSENYALLQGKLNTIRQQCEKIREERNAFILKTQILAESRATILIERDALKLETENFQSKIKHTDMYEKELNAARRHCDDIKKDRDFYKLKARQAAENTDALKKDIDALTLEIEELRAQCKKNSLLEKQLKYVRQECENIKKERNRSILRAPSTAADSEVMRKKRDAQKIAEVKRTQRFKAAVQGEQLNVTREDCDNLAKERDSLILKVQHMGTDREATKEELDSAERQVEELNVVREDFDNLAKDIDSLILEVQQVETDTEVTEDELDEAALLEEQLNIREDGDNIAKF